MKSKSYYRFLQCPACRSGSLVVADDGNTLACGACNASFASVSGRPILFDPSNAVFPAQAYLKHAPVVGRPQRDLTKWLPSPSVNLSRGAVLARMRATLDTRGVGDVVVVGGGRQRLAICGAAA